MTPYKIRVYETLRRLYKDNHLRHVTTKRIVKAMGQSYHRTYRALRQLEDEGVVACKRSRSSSWKPLSLRSCVYGKLLQSYRRSHDYVPTYTVAVQLNQNERIIRDELATLEAAGIVTRSGERGGWQPVRTPPRTATERLMDAFDQLGTRKIPTRTIANHLDISARHARRILNTVEQQGIVSRTSPRSGWHSTLN